MLLDSQVCCDAIYFLAKFGEQLHAALATFFADVAGYLAFFLHLVEGRFQFSVNFEQAAVLCGQCIGLHFQNLVTKKGTGDTRMPACLPSVPSGSERELHGAGGSIFDQDHQLFCWGTMSPILTGCPTIARR